MGIVSLNMTAAGSAKLLTRSSPSIRHLEPEQPLLARIGGLLGNAGSRLVALVRLSRPHSAASHSTVLHPVTCPLPRFHRVRRHSLLGVLHPVGGRDAIAIE